MAVKIRPAPLEILQRYTSSGFFSGVGLGDGSGKGLGFISGAMEVVPKLVQPDKIGKRIEMRMIFLTESIFL